MKFFISFQKFSNKVIILCIILQILVILQVYNLYIINNIKIENYFIFTQLKNISHIFMIIMFLIQKKISRNSKIKNKNEYKIIINKLDKNQFSKKKFDYIILFSFLIITITDFIDGNFYLFQIKNSGQVSQIVSCFFFLKLFNHNIYRHHYFGLLLSIISFLNDTIIFIFIVHKKIDIFIFLDSLFIQTMIGLKFTIEKYLIEIKYFNRYLMLFYEGIYGLIINIIYYLFLYFFNKSFLINFIFIKKNILFLLLYMIEFFFIESIRVLLASLTKNIIFFLAIIFTAYIGKYIFFRKKNIIKFFIIYPDMIICIINPILNILGCFIFCEIIIFNFCKLNENIETEIIKRAEKEKEIKLLSNQ